MRLPPKSALDGLGARRTESQEAPVSPTPGEARASITFLHFTCIVVVKTDIKSYLNKSSLTQLSKIADENDVNLIIFDTYSNTSGLVDEDAAGPASVTISNAKTIKTDAAILFTHHPRKSDENTRHPEPRGSGVPKAASDVVMTMFIDNDRSLPAGNKWISLSTESQHAGKNRDARTETIRGLRLDQTKTKTPVITWSKENLVPDSVRKIESVLTGEMTLRELADALSLSSKTIDRYLSLGIEMGRFTRITSGAANKPHRYRLKG